MSAPAPPAMPLPPNIASLTTPLILGEIFNGYLYGVLSVQVYLYYITFRGDASYIKMLVYGVFAIDTASTLMCLADTYHWFASGFGSLAALDDIHLSGFDTPMIGAIIAAIVQVFYCFRIWKIDKRAWPISVLVILIALAEVTAGIYGGVVGTKAKTFSNAADKTIVAIYIVFVGAAAADVLIMLTMMYLLRRSRQKDHQQSSRMISKIINLTAETNLLSTSLALLTVILLVACPGTNYFTCPSIILGKIYSNSLLLILNNRHYLNSSRGNNEFASNSFKFTSFRPATSLYTASDPSSSQHGGIHIGLNTNVTTDSNKLPGFSVETA